MPGDIDFAECDSYGPKHFFESWTGGNDGDRYRQGPGQIDRLWIPDIDGVRLVIDAFDMPAATDAEREELLAVMASIRFEEQALASPSGAPSTSPALNQGPAASGLAAGPG